MTMSTIIEYTGDTFAEVSDTIAERYLLDGYVTRTNEPGVYLLTERVTCAIPESARKLAAWDAKHAHDPFAQVVGFAWDQTPRLATNATVRCENPY